MYELLFRILVSTDKKYNKKRDNDRDRDDNNDRDRYI